MQMKGEFHHTKKKRLVLRVDQFQFRFGAEEKESSQLLVEMRQRIDIWIILVSELRKRKSR